MNVSHEILENYILDGRPHQDLFGKGMNPIILPPAMGK